MVYTRESMKAYTEKNKENLSKLKECQSCQTQVTAWNWFHHVRSKKHQSILKAHEASTVDMNELKGQITQLQNQLATITKPSRIQRLDDMDARNKRYQDEICNNCKQEKGSRHTGPICIGYNIERCPHCEAEFPKKAC